MTPDQASERLRLPSYLTRFVGREPELMALRRLLRKRTAGGVDGSAPARLTTLCGVGGSGKTRLALETARAVIEAPSGSASFSPGAVHWVAIGPLQEASQVARAIAGALGQPAAVPDQAVAGLLRTIGDERLLIVLDNCEHLLDACRAIVSPLLAGCPRLVLLTTSRIPLGLAAETVLPVPPLRSTPTAGAPDGCPVQSEAARLFLDRAAMVSGYGSSESAGRTIDQICERLDGLPLAIELAASWMRVLSARDLLREITHGIDFLSSSSPDLLERHWSLQVVLDSSWRRLTAQDQRLLSALSVFSGEFSREAAVAVGGATLASLSALAEKSLIQRRPEVEDETRYHIHELVRQYALQRLEEEDVGEAERVRSAHLAYFLTLVERAEGAWDTAVEREWLDRLRTEQANISAALSWALDQRRAEESLRLSAGLFAYWTYTLPPALYRGPLERALALPWDESSDSMMRARARALNVAGYVSVTAAEYAHALDLFEQGLDLYRRLDDTSSVAWALRGRGYARRHSGNPDPDDDLQSLDLCRAAGDAAGVAWSVHDLGEVAFALGDLGQAEQLLNEGLILLEQRGVWFGAYRAVILLAGLHVRRERWVEAVARYEDALVRQHASRFVAFGGDILDGLGVAAAALHRPVIAARLLGFGAVWRQISGYPRGPYDVGVDPTATAVRRQLGPAAWSVHYDAGRRLTSDQMMAEAQLHCQELSSAAAAQQNQLTDRQLQVLLALAQGLSNAEIASQLVLSPRTVHAHVRSIFAKLAVSTRTAAARRAAELNLV